MLLGNEARSGRTRKQRQTIHFSLKNEKEYEKDSYTYTQAKRKRMSEIVLLVKVEETGPNTKLQLISSKIFQRFLVVRYGSCSGLIQFR